MMYWAWRVEGKGLHPEMKNFFCERLSSVWSNIYRRHGHSVQAKFMPFEVVLLLSKEGPFTIFGLSSTQLPLLYLLSTSSNSVFKIILAFWEANKIEISSLVRTQPGVSCRVSLTNRILISHWAKCFLSAGKKVLLAKAFTCKNNMKVWQRKKETRRGKVGQAGLSCKNALSKAKRIYSSPGIFRHPLLGWSVMQLQGYFKLC